MLGAFTIDVVSDVVCPWCYIGKRRLEAALARLRESEPDLPIQVRWHPFQLNPDLPAEGIDRRQYVETKFGGPERARQVYARVGAAGETVGIPFAFNAIQRQPNTLDAHRLVAWAQSAQRGRPGGAGRGAVSRVLSSRAVTSATARSSSGSRRRRATIPPMRAPSSTRTR
jgi:predicted DsbA family dithiol-disulfide isomerase